MSEQLKKALVNNPRLLDYYNAGPVERATIEDFVQSLTTEIVAVVEAGRKFAEQQPVYSDTDKRWCAAKVFQSEKIIANINLYCDNLLGSK